MADKYSNQMSVPLWDPGAQIQTIPGLRLTQKTALCGLCWSVLEYKCVKSKMNQFFCQMSRSTKAVKFIKGDLFPNSINAKSYEDITQTNMDRNTRTHQTSDNPTTHTHFCYQAAS